MQKDFDKWNGIKKRIHAQAKDNGSFPKEGEIWMCIIGRNIGFEQNGGGENFSRPVLVTKKFNNQMFWMVPLSTKQKSLDFYYNFTDPSSRKVSVILAQLRLVSIKRFKRKMYELSAGDFSKIKLRLKDFLS
ncbi:MAG: type II toxin-antitoxin system PemK/MazF family toxin [bacterium]|nr:type II toxin-antitoxin system PemK/MazF family toxin [bacterium]